MAEDQPSRETVEQLVERLDRLERLLRDNASRLRAVERRLQMEAPPATDGQSPGLHRTPLEEKRETASPSAPPPIPTAPPRAEPSPRAFGDGAQAAGASRAEEPNVAERRAVRRDFETVVGGSWFNWIGIIAVTFGVAFFLKYAFENQWVGPAARVGMGVLAGFALLAVAERLRGRGLRQYAFVLSGGGILILYLSIYAAYNFYRLIAQAPAFLLMASVTAMAVLLAVRQNALPVAVLGLVGGFLTPVLLSTGQDNQAALFGYVALLDAGVLAVAYFKRWRSLNFLSFAATLLITLGWMLAHYAKGKLWPTLFFLTLFFLLYSLLAVVHNVLPRRPARWSDVVLVSINATFYFGISYLLLVDAGYAHTPASHALLVSALYVGLFYAVWSLNRADRLLTYSYIGAAVTFFTVAVAIQLELHWVTVAWAVEGLVLTWVGLRSGESAPRRAALFVFGVAVLHWFGWDMLEFAYRADAPFIPIFNRRALSCAALVGALAAGAWLYRREGGGVEEAERAAAATLYSLAANALALTLLTLDLNDYFERRKVLAGGGADDLAGRVENTRQFSITALWAFYGATMLAFGVRRSVRLLRYVALSLLVLATIKALALDLPFYAAPWHVPVFNQTFMAFALLVAAYAFAARLYAKAGHVGEEERGVIPALVVVANALAIVALSAETSGYFQSEIAEARRAASVETVASPVLNGRLRDLELAKQLSLSVVWALYGAALLVVGRARGVRLLRVMSLVLLGLTTLKVFFWDLASLDRVYRIISFILLGAILLAVSYLYQKSQQRAGVGEEGEAPTGA